jgi:periplasmic protein CpxP/Spy
MFKRVLVAAGLVAALAGGAAVAIAQPPQGGGPGIGGPGRGPRLRGFGGPMGDLGLRGVDLTDAQKEQLRAIRESHKQEVEQAGAKLREAHRGLAEAADAQTVDESTIRARSTAVATAMADEAILRARVRAEVQGILTAEQLQKMQERKAEMQKRRQGRRQQ